MNSVTNNATDILLVLLFKRPQYSLVAISYAEKI